MSSWEWYNDTAGWWSMSNVHLWPASNRVNSWYTAHQCRVLSSWEWGNDTAGWWLMSNLHLWQASNVRVNVRVSVSWEWCNDGKWPVLSLDRLHLWQPSTFQSRESTQHTVQCPVLECFTFKNAISDKLTVQCLSWEVNNPSQVETDATKSQAWHQFWRKSPQHRKVWHRPHMTVLRFLFDKQDVKCAAK